MPRSEDSSDLATSSVIATVQWRTSTMTAKYKSAVEMGRIKEESTRDVEGKESPLFCCSLPVVVDYIQVRAIATHNSHDTI